MEPTQIVAHTELAGDFRIVPVARLLDTSASQTKRHLRVKPGDEVQRGDVIAKRGRLPARSVKSPIDGTVTASSGGRILIEAPSTLFELRAYIDGTVTNVLEPHGLVIETTGAVIQGVWGGGGGPSSENLGILRCMVKNPDEPLRAHAMDLSCRGMILVGGAGLDNVALEQAQEFQVGGIVVGGLLPELISQVEQLPFPVITTEGIGTTSMSEPVFRLLTTHDGREASISGRTQPRWPTVRPEIIIPLPAATLPPSQMQLGAPLTVGRQVRAVRAPYMGAVGTITALPAHTRRIKTGAKVLGAEVDLGQGAPVFIPLANLQVLR
ncbi:MAG: hypothetical protein V3S14_03480 [Anaerolineae bacterium]